VLALGALGVVSVGGAQAQWWGDDDVEIEGYIEALPDNGLIGEWKVAGRTIHVNEQTEIDSDGEVIRVGLFVEVEGLPQPDGSIIAEEIEVEDDD
jgi:hypothetical protein